MLGKRLYSETCFRYGRGNRGIIKLNFKIMKSIYKKIKKLKIKFKDINILYNASFYKYE